MRIGYARVSTHEQDNTAQISALHARRLRADLRGEGLLRAAGIAPSFCACSISCAQAMCWWSGNSTGSPGPSRTCWSSRKVQAVGAGFLSLTEAIDTTTAAGRMMMHIVGSFAEFERAMLRERTRNGLLAARKDGRIGGRRPKLTPRHKKNRPPGGLGHKTAADAARLFNVHPSTVARLLARSRLTK